MIRVKHNLHRLADDYAGIPVKAASQMPGIVKENADYGRDLAKALAKVLAGPHGKNYYKRINSELTGPLTAEFGPDGTPKSDFVGVGYRNGKNDDLDQAAKPTGTELASDVRRMIARLYR